MPNSRPHPPRPDRIRSIHGSFSWIDHRFLRQGFDQGLTRLEKLLYFVLVAVSNQEGVSFYSDQRLGELLDIRFPHELVGARSQLVARDLIAFEGKLYQVLELPARPPTGGTVLSNPPPRPRAWVGSFSRPFRPSQPQFPASDWKSLRQILKLLEQGEGQERRTHESDGLDR
jgi:hypothetical protein